MAHLSELSEVNEELHKRIQLCNEVNDADKFSFNDINAVGFLKRLAKIDQDPSSIWEAVGTVFGEDFFTKIIEKEYGVNSNTFVSMNDRISKKITEHKTKLENEFAATKRQMENKISEMQAVINSKQLELMMMRESWK